MLKPTLSFLAILAVMSLLVVQPTKIQAQTSEQGKAAKIKEQIRGVDTKVPAKLKIKMNDRTKLEGSLQEARDKDFVVVDKTGTLKTVAYSEVDSVGVTQASTKVKIIAGVVIGVAAGIILFFVVNESKR